jgi:type IV pilus assembly protein PilW
MNRNKTREFKVMSLMNIISETPSRQRGVSVVELMVAMALGLFLLAALVTILLNGKDAFGSANQLSRLQENGRIATNLIVSDLKRAGYMGGNSAKELITGTADQQVPAGSCDSGNTSWGRMVTAPVFGLNDGINGYGCIPVGTYLRGDVITMRYASPWIAQPPYNPNQLYLRSSLFDGRIFKGSDEANVDNKVEDEPNSVRELMAYSYFIGDSGRTCRGEVVPSLWRVRLDANGQPLAEELLPGVEHLQVQFGTITGTTTTTTTSQVGGTYTSTTTTTNGQGKYENASQIAGNDNWANVNTVRLWLLIRSECPENGYVDGRTYNLGDVAYTPPNDNFRRQLYSSVVMIRN